MQASLTTRASGSKRAQRCDLGESAGPRQDRPRTSGTPAGSTVGWCARESGAGAEGGVGLGVASAREGAAEVTTSRVAESKGEMCDTVKLRY